MRTEEPVTTALSESIPKFHFPQGRPQANLNIDGLISKIEKTFSQFPNERATIEDMGQVAKVRISTWSCGCSMICLNVTPGAPYQLPQCGLEGVVRGNLNAG